MNKDWNKDYIDNGIYAQRLYPNEALIAFMGGCNLLSGKRNVRILEVGCGSGANLWMIAKEGHEAYGMDYSDEGLKIAAEHLENKWGVQPAGLKQGSFTEIPYEDNFFDYVIDVVSMQHISIEDSLIALKEIRRILKPGGRFFSYRLGEGTTSYLHGFGKEDYIDSVTRGNIGDPAFPLYNNGTVSYWSAGLAQKMYTEARLSLIGIERNTRTYDNGRYKVEYLSIIAEKE